MLDETASSPTLETYDAFGASAPTHPLDELVLYAHRPFQDDSDPRPLPEPEDADTAIFGAMNAITDLLTGTRLEDDLPDLLWSFANVFHRQADRISRQLDDNEQQQRRSQTEQDGTEVKSVELERLIALGLSLTERRNAFEYLRDAAAENYAAHTGSAWRPRVGSMVNHKTLTAAMIDSKDFINAKRRAEAQVLLPPGPRIAFTGGQTYNDHTRIWAVARQGPRQAPHDGPAARGHADRRRADRRLLGGSPEGAARRLQARLGHATRRPRPSSATMRCWKPCRSGSSSSRAPASPRTWPTRPARWASRSSASPSAPPAIRPALPGRFGGRA